MTCRGTRSFTRKPYRRLLTPRTEPFDWCSSDVNDFRNNTSPGPCPWINNENYPVNNEPHTPTDSECWSGLKYVDYEHNRGQKSLPLTPFSSSVGNGVQCTPTGVKEWSLEWEHWRRDLQTSSWYPYNDWNECHDGSEYPSVLKRVFAERLSNSYRTKPRHRSEGVSPHTLGGDLSRVARLKDGSGLHHVSTT